MITLKTIAELQAKGVLLIGKTPQENAVNRAKQLLMLDDTVAKTTSGADSDLLSDKTRTVDARVGEAVVSFGDKGKDLDRNVVVSMRDTVNGDTWYTMFLHIRPGDISAYYKNLGINQGEFKTVLDYVKMSAEIYSDLEECTKKRLNRYKLFTDGSKVVNDRPAALPKFKSSCDFSLSWSGSLKKWDVHLEGDLMYQLNPSWLLLQCFRGISPEVGLALREAGYCIEHIHRSAPGKEAEERVFDLSNLQIAPSNSFNRRLSALRPWDRR